LKEASTLTSNTQIPSSLSKQRWRHLQLN